MNINFGLDTEKVVTESGSSTNRHRAAHRRICATNGACERIYIRRSMQPSTSLAVKPFLQPFVLGRIELETLVTEDLKVC